MLEIIKTFQDPMKLELLPKHLTDQIFIPLLTIHMLNLSKYTEMTDPNQTPTKKKAKRTPFTLLNYTWDRNLNRTIQSVTMD